jgi:ABC-type Fe3+-hydroxamate transport system substrate-binding protein
LPDLVDASGVGLALTRPPRRIVSLVPSLTETLCALGLADALVGITVYCREPRDLLRGKTRIGGEKNPDLARIRELGPDLVVANVEENVAEHVATLRAWSIPVWVTYPRTVAAGIAMIRELGVLTGTAARADAIAAPLEAQLARVSAASARRPPVRVFYAIWREPWMTVGRDTYIHDMLRVCGAQNVFGDRPERYPTVTLEDVAAAHPDVVLLPDEPFRFRRAHAEELEGLAPRIELVDGKPFSWHGPRIGEALRTLPALFGAVGEQAAAGAGDP